jgi:hypothetical protein
VKNDSHRNLIHNILKYNKINKACTRENINNNNKYPYLCVCYTIYKREETNK